MDGIELALYCAHSASDALVCIYYAASALEASLCFLGNLILCEVLDFIVHRHLLALVDASDLTLWSLVVINREYDVILVERCEDAGVTVNHLVLSDVNVSVQGYSAFASHCESINYELLTGYDISACEDVRICSLESDWICDDEASRRELNLCTLEECAVIRLLSDGEEYCCAGFLCCFLVIELRIESALSVLNRYAFSELNALDRKSVV